ncbi:hypothetical protein [Subdoligranulum variabile]|uniref:Tat pathway signal sequence domain protein n=1 Tax=Subdoligranulum variabile DSM 15176 TaxID=411471 RepID=D1PQI8_9FIRM|nr:hypothetical protein [Subdoligranulum variabile]EFB75046.1 hypothetical protein SUBVAR_06657 [Subdoligranulum variabile DSM 15176]UWP69692.1 hypothetical protein NQ490_07535 [Subdoligranulum variabile]
MPALVGKFTNYDVGQTTMMFWFACGIFLVCHILCNVLEEEKKHWYTIFVVFVVLMLFGTFITPMSGIYKVLEPEAMGDGIHWFTSELRIQYTSNLMLMRWVTPQFVPTALCVALLVQYRKKPAIWGLILAPLAIYSTFTFVGMAFLMLLLFLFDLLAQAKKERLTFFKSLFSLENIAALFVALLLLAYIACNYLQSKPESANLGFKIVDYRQYPDLFILFHLAWLIWVYILWLRERKNRLLYASMISLFLIPFMAMGKWGDFCMRASVPALEILCILVAKELLWSLREKKIYLTVGLVLCLLFTSVGPLKEIDKSFDQTNWGERNYLIKYDGIEEYFDSADFIRYQYVDWEPDGFARYLLQ